MWGSTSKCCHLAVIVCLLGFVLAQDEVVEVPTGKRRVTIPPLILVEPPKEMAFREGESVEMPCQSSGEPEPTYKWQFNGKDFDPSGNDGRIAIQPGVGTLIFANPIMRDEGLYQCFAFNGVGIAVTVKVNLRLGILEPFPSVTTVRTHYPQLGHSLVLSCTPPRSFPPAQIFWVTVAENNKFTPVYFTNRVSMDPEGNLNIANIIADDAQHGHSYACVAQNKVMRRTQQGEYQRISPRGAQTSKTKPALMWTHPNYQVALRGETWRIKCIFSGHPTPRVEWDRHGAPMSPRYREESFGQELVIDNVQYEDAGQYECSGINEQATTPIRRSFELSIQSKPYWVRKPVSVDAAENEMAVFHCEAEGDPDPIYYWFINGLPITEVESDPRRVVETKKMTFYNVTKEDAQVIQCNATNNHGYIFKNAYLNVLSEPPMIRVPPLEEQISAEGQTIEMICEVFGSPKPLVSWRKGNEQLTGGRFKVMQNGNLQITDLSLVDAGSYTCLATNRFGQMSAMGSLVVRRKTMIRTAPLDVMVYEGTEAKFTCTATTDPEEVGNLRIDWKKDGQTIDYNLAQRIFKNDLDNSLTISGTISLDTGKYTCMASNRLDSDESSAQLVVQAPPDPPNNVHVRCYDRERKAELFWQPGKENYAPILNFIVQFNTTFAQDTWIDIETNVSQNERKKDVILSPYGNYTFRVLARNKIGMSNPSLHTVHICSTVEDLPDKNPENVIGEGDEPDNLVVFWTPMPKIEQNGPDFKYIITYRKADEDDTDSTLSVEIAEAYHILIMNQPTYTRYYITVRAQNSVGDARVHPKTVIGWSGESAPKVRPQEVTYDDTSVTGTTVLISWRKVDTSPDVINGFFRGYRIQYWPSGEDEENVREVDYIINKPLQYPRPRYKRQAGDENDEEEEEKEDPYESYYLTNLPAYQEITIQVRTLNKYYAGPASDRIYVTTLAGEPGPPAAFEVIARGSTHFELAWAPPLEPNGVLVGYNISYQSITGLNLGRLQYREAIEDENIHRARLTGLQPFTDYRVYLSAATHMGKGEPIFLDAMTTTAGPPSAPTFDIVDIGDNWCVLKWEPSRSGNPGSVFYVQFRPRGSYHWLHSTDSVLHYEANVTMLDTGTTYQIRVLSKNGIGDEAPAEWQEFQTGGVGPGRIELATAVWFYGIFIAVVLIIVLMVIFVLVKRYRDEWWVRKEASIAEQVRQLQAEEAAAQLAYTNDYATGSREQMDTSHASLTGSDYKPPMQVEEDEEDEGDDSDEYDDDDDDEGGFTKEGVPYGAQPGYQPQYGQPGVHSYYPPPQQSYAPAPQGQYTNVPGDASYSLGEKPPGPGSSFV